MITTKERRKNNMDVRGQITFFVSLRSGKRFYEASLSRKQKDGTYTHAKIDVEFGKNAISQERLDALKENVAYTMDVEGFLTANVYTDKAGKSIHKVVIHCEKVTPIKAKECTPSEKKPQEDLPF